MLRSSRLLFATRHCRSGRRPTVPGRHQPCRRKTGNPNESNVGGASSSRATAALGAATISSGVGLLSFLCLAKWSPKFRRWAESNVPGSKSLFTMVLKKREAKVTTLNSEDKAVDFSISKSATTKTTAEASPSSEDTASSSTEEEKVVKWEEQLKEQDDLEEQLRLAVLEEEKRIQEEVIVKAEREAQRKRIENEAQQLVEDSVKEAEDRAKAEEDERTQALKKIADEEQAASKSVSLTLDDSLQLMLSSVGESSKAMYTLAKALRQHSMSVYKYIESQASHDDVAMIKAEAAVDAALAGVQDAQSQVDESAELVNKAVRGFDALCNIARKGDGKETAQALSEMANQALKQLHETAEEVAVCRADQTVLQHFSQQMTQQCESYKQEMLRLSEMHYAVDSPSQSDEVSGAQTVFDADIRSLLSFAQQRVESMQESLASGQQQDAETISALLLQQRQEDMQVAQLKMDHLREQLAREHQEDLQRHEVQFRVSSEEEIKHQLQRQAAAHSDHLRTALENQAKEIGTKYQRMVDNALKEQSFDFQLVYHQLAGYMQGLESVAGSAVDDIQKGMKSVELCKACSSLLLAVDKSAVEKRPLQPLVDHLKAVSAEDPTITVALASIPEEALQHGVQSADCLQQRFEAVKTACSRVAFLGEKTEAGILAYAMAHVFSLLRWEKASDSTSGSGSVLDAAASTDTIQLLQLAEKEVKDGKIDNAVRLVNQLGGQARVLAQDWLNEARLYVSTRQAADVIGSCALLQVQGMAATEPEPTPAAVAAEERED